MFLHTPLYIKVKEQALPNNMLNYSTVILLIVGLLGWLDSVCYAQANKSIPWPSSLSEELELKAGQYEQAGEKTLSRVTYGQSIVERTKSGILTIMAQGGKPWTKYLYQPFDDVIIQGEALQMSGQSQAAEELYIKTLKQLEPLQARSSSTRRLQQQLYLLNAACGLKSAEQNLAELTLQVLDEWGPYSELYTSLLYEQIQYYDKTRNLPLLTEVIRKMSLVLRQRQRHLAAFLLNDLEYDTFLALHQRYIDQLLCICVKYHKEQPGLKTIIADYLLASRNLQLNGQRIIREHFIVKTVAEGMVAFGMSVGIPYLQETVKETSPDSKEHQEAVDEIARRQTLIQQVNTKARRNQLYIDWTTTKLKSSQDRGAYEQLESQLIDSVGQFIDQLTLSGPAAVMHMLKPDQAIIDFFSYTDGVYPPNSGYAAIVYTQHRSSPDLILLGSRADIWQLSERQRRQTSTDDYQLMSSINQLYSSSRLYELLWKPLMPMLNGIHRIDYLPIDLLNAVAFDALLSEPGGKPLCEQFTIKRILTVPAAFADSITLVPERLSERQINADFWGGIIYDAKAAKIPHNTKLPNSAIPLRGAVATLTRGRKWTALKGADKEINKVRNILKVFGKRNLEIYTKTKASEFNFKYQYTNLVHPHILHIATHGFYDKMTLKSLDQEANKFSSPYSETMLKAGLVLAGANIPPESGQEDGILTALEISQLNLNSKLVVLSACESGLGEQKSNEGILGLQRAFKLAGAEYLLMTLWEIPDQETADMMDFFYSNLVQGQSVERAFQNAQFLMKSRHPPFYWAGFVLLR